MSKQRPATIVAFDDYGDVVRVMYFHDSDDAIAIFYRLQDAGIKHAIITMWNVEIYQPGEQPPDFPTLPRQQVLFEPEADDAP